VGVRIEANMTQIIEWLNQHNINAVKAIGTVAILILASIVIPRLGTSLKQWLIHLQSRLNLTNKTNSIINRVIIAVLWTLIVFIVLDVWGIGLGGVWAVLVGAVTIIGVGFIATWAMTSNFTASFFLVLWRPFRVGQTVEILPENLKGRVVDRNLMFTTLSEDSGSVLQIPNSLFFQKIFRVSGDQKTSLTLHKDD
ncbi:MAG TPA: mechanosensitive ion channel family protein, partial [Xanthobacteraceae bacterium]